MHGNDLGRVDMIFVNHDIPGKVTHGNDPVGRKHSAGLDVKHAGIDMFLVAAVIRSRVNVNDKRFAGQFLCGNSGEICEPVVSVDDIKLILVLKGNGASDHCISGHFFHKVGAVFAGEFVLHSILDLEVLDLTLSLLLDYGFELIRIHIRNQIRVNVNEFHLVEKLIHRRADRIHGHITGIDDGSGALVLVS